jgi:hypothetical protein
MGRTLHHDVPGPSRRRQGLLRAAPAGTGIIAGGPMRAVFETLGVQDVVAKSTGSSNPYNMVRATFDALKNQVQPEGHRSPARYQGIAHAAGSPRSQAVPMQCLKNKEPRSWPRKLKRRRRHRRTDRFADPPSDFAARNADRSRPQQDAPRPYLEDTPSVRGMIAAVSISFASSTRSETGETTHETQ